MLRLAFFGIETRILDQLRHCRVDLAGAYLPPAPYWIRKRWPFLSKFPRIVKKFFRTVAAYGYFSDFLEENKIPALKSADVNSKKFKEIFSRLNPDLAIVSNFGQIIGASLLRIPKYGFINMHPSILPKYRGADPLGHILLNAEKTSGVTWHQMTTKIDCGDILAQETFPVEHHYRIKDLETKSIALAINMLEPLLEDIEKGQLKPKAPDETDATYYPKLTKREKKQLKAMESGKS